ncbi:MAG TPA: macro domain-containing protein [Roseiflexaceae bacterium]|jgi:O-acetyl-ADP-ribose deacetylase (regulator of RNase III)|nr:macro domain-containing protein [Roseiflexaceae bacterium]
MNLQIVTGDLLGQPVEVIVNAWNQNIVPWWLLRPHGVSGAIKRHAGTAPFQELRSYGRLARGQAVLTSAGKLPCKGIIHVASITWSGRSNSEIVQQSVHNALELAQSNGFISIAFPILGSGSGGMNEQTALDSMLTALQTVSFDGTVYVVQYRPTLATS